MSEPTKKCHNCEKEIAVTKYILHEPFCLRNVVKCDHCGEPVTKDEMEDHHNENHKLSDCLDCGKIFEKRLLSSHKKKCVHKPVTCKYCSLEVAKNDLHDHEYMCGSKTEPCHHCGEPVPLMEYDLHVEYTCKGESTSNDKASDNNFEKNKENIKDVLSAPSINQPNKKFKPPSRKVNLDEYSRNLESLKKEFEKTNEIRKKTSQVVSSINNIHSHNSNHRNHLSNNANITNRKIDEFIDLSEDDHVIKSKKTNEFHSKKSSNAQKNTNFNNKQKKKSNFSNKVKNTGNLNISRGVDYGDDYDDDILQAIIEQSKHEK